MKYLILLAVLLCGSTFAVKFVELKEEVVIEGINYAERHINPIERNLDAPYRIGLNMIRTTDSYDNTHFDTPQKVTADMKSLGAQGMRQLQQYDLTWFQVYDGTGSLNSSSNYDFSDAKKMMANDEKIYTIPTLFWIGPGSAARYFEGDGFNCDEDSSKYCNKPYTPDDEVLKVSDSSVENDIEDYLDFVGKNFKELGLKHYEVGNEASRFKYIDSSITYTWYWSPQKYVDLLEKTSDTLKSVDADIQIVMAGTFYNDLHDRDDRKEKWEDYFDKVLNKGGGSYIDIVNTHFYGNWWQLRDHLEEVQELMDDHGIGHKPLWLTEVGISATEKGEQRQAEDIFRYFSVAFCNGVELINWHTHINSHDGEGNWGGYGLRKKYSARYPSYYSYRLFSEKFGNFGSCTPIKNGSNKLYVYRFRGSLYEEWGSMPQRFIVFSKEGDKKVNLERYFSEGARVRITSVYAEDGDFETHTQAASKNILAKATPKIVEIAE